MGSVEDRQAHTRCPRADTVGFSANAPLLPAHRAKQRDAEQASKKGARRRQDVRTRRRGRPGGQRPSAERGFLGAHGGRSVKRVASEGEGRTNAYVNATIVYEPSTFPNAWKYLGTATAVYGSTKLTNVSVDFTGAAKRGPSPAAWYD